MTDKKYSLEEEYFEIIDDAKGTVIGLEPRSKCHNNPSFVHRSVHVLVCHPDGKNILLQKRSMRKDIQPGKWDISVGGHLMPGEDFEVAARREMAEEIGLKEPLPLRFLFDFKIRNERESENVRVFSVTSKGPFEIQESELECVAYHSLEQLKQKLLSGDTSAFTPVLCEELKQILGDE